MRKFCVFDLDGTIINTQSGAQFALYLFKKHLLAISDALRLAWWAFCYGLHIPCNQDTARTLVFKGLQGITKDELMTIIRDFHEDVLVRHYRPRALEEIRTRKQEGCVVLLVSASFYGIAHVVAKHLGLDGVVATKMRFDDERRVTNCVEGHVVEGTEKVEQANAWIREFISEHCAHSEEKFLDEHDKPFVIAYAYGDHHSDTPLLKEATHAFAVNPDRVLRARAQAHGWTIVDWDV